MLTIRNHNRILGAKLDLRELRTLFVFFHFYGNADTKIAAGTGPDVWSSA